MPEVQISVAQIRRSVLEYRRTIKRNSLTREIERCEEYLEFQVGAYLPIRSRCPLTPQGKRSAECERVQRLRRAVGWYRLHGRPILRRDGRQTIDEVVDGLTGRDASGMPADAAIESLATQIETVRQLRGRGGRYGMLSHGLSSSVLTYIWQYPLDSELLRDELEDATEHITKLVAEALVPYAEGPETTWLRQEYWQLEDDGACDGDFANLLRPDDAALLSIVRPTRLSWCRIAQATLGILPNQPAATVADIVELTTKPLPIAA